MSRLEEIKSWVKARQGKHPDDVRWLISRVEELEANQDRIIKIAENRLTYIRDLQNRVEALEEEKYQDPRQGMIEDLHMENERYKQALEEIKGDIEMAEKYGFDAWGFVEDTKSIVNEALKGDTP